MKTVYGPGVIPRYRILSRVSADFKTLATVGATSFTRLKNVVERWNGTNSFIFFGKGGEVATNRLEDQEVSVLALHLLQNCLVYVNTLMIQNVLGDEEWMDRMADEDLRALTPLIHSHVNPYGSFELDMEKRLPLDEPVAVAV